jgi:hypothetical protein
MSKTYDLFISHSWNYTDAYEKLCDILDDASHFSYRNYSIPKDDPVHDTNNAQELYDAIRAKMAHAQVVIIMAGKYSTYSNWIKKEIRCAKDDLGKPILGIKPWASTQVSSVVAKNADEMVNWNTKSIVSAIRDLGS